MNLHRLILLMVAMWMTGSLIHKEIVPVPGHLQFHESILGGEPSLRELAKLSWQVGPRANSVLQALDSHPNKEVRHRARAIVKIRERQAKLVSQGVPFRIWIP